MPQTSEHNNELVEFPELKEPVIYECLSGMIDRQFTEMFLTISTQHSVHVFTFWSSNLMHVSEEKLFWEGMYHKFIFIIFLAY